MGGCQQPCDTRATRTTKVFVRAIHRTTLSSHCSSASAVRLQSIRAHCYSQTASETLYVAILIRVSLPQTTQRPINLSAQGCAIWATTRSRSLVTGGRETQARRSFAPTQRLGHEDTRCTSLCILSHQLFCFLAYLEPRALYPCVSCVMVRIGSRGLLACTRPEDHGVCKHRTVQLLPSVCRRDGARVARL